MKLGTLLRVPQINDEYLSFLHGIGLNCCQIASLYDDILTDRPRSDAMVDCMKRNDLPPVSAFLSFPNQIWSGPDKDVGITPPKNRAFRMTLSCREMLWCKRYGINDIVCHIGDLPETAEEYEMSVRDFQYLVRFANENGQRFLLETGMEKCEDIEKLFADVACDNLGLNLDPANLLIYNADVPQRYIERLSDKILGVHCKDAVPPADGETRGHETPLGAGATGFAGIFHALTAKGYNAPFIIERELQPGPEQQADITKAAKWILSGCN